MASSSSLLNFLSPLFPSTTPQQPQHPSLFSCSSLPNPKFPQSSPNSNSNSNSNSNPLSLSSKNGVLGHVIPPKEECPADLMAVVCPSMAYSNTLFFAGGGYNVEIMVEDNEPEERLLGRFRREVMKAGIIQECKRRRYFENPQEQKKRKTRESARRNSRRRRGFQRGPFQSSEEGEKVVDKGEEELDEDNWEMPDGDAPF